eukprot:2160855-Amphidinium_carterae.1
MRRSIQSYLLATASAPKPMPMDLGYLPWSNKGKGKDGKGNKGHKGEKGKVVKTAGGTVEREAKESQRTKVSMAKATERVAVTPAKEKLTLQATVASAACGVTSRRTAGDR